MIAEISLLLPSSLSILGYDTIGIGSQAMGELLNASAQESSPADSGKWIVRIVIAVVLGEAIWGFLVSITNYIVLPTIIKVIGGDAQASLRARSGDFNVPGLFTSVLELCLAAIVAALLYSWSQKSGSVQSTRVHLAPVAAPLPTHVVAPAANPPATAAGDTANQADAPVSVQSAPQPTQLSRQVAKPAKRKSPKVVHYNIVGEPVDDDE